MEAQQCVKLSFTNRSIGLIPLRSRKGTPSGKRENTKTVASSDELPLSRFAFGKTAVKGKAGGAAQTELRCRSRARQSDEKTRYAGCCCFAQSKAAEPCLDDLVAMARGQTPDPIPNSAVKTLSADGTAS